MLARFPAFLAALLLALAALAPPVLATAATGGMRVVATDDGAIVRLALSEALPGPPSVFLLDNPMRVAIDLAGASSLRKEAAGAGAVKEARVAQFDPATVRIVVELRKPLELVAATQDAEHVLELRFGVSTAPAFAARLAGGRKAIAFAGQAPGTATPTAAAAPAEGNARIAAIEGAIARAEQAVAAKPAASASGATKTASAAAAAAAPVVSAPAAPHPKGKARYVVVLDAGHGGTDPGAPATNGRQEKEATLAIARAAKAAIERLARAKALAVDVRMTRDADHFVSLGQRVRLARDWKADLFLSVHADSAPNSDARGASVYTLSETASDREAARAAAKENRADLIAGVDLSSENREVASILIDLGMRDSQNSSADFAETLQGSLQPEGVEFRSQFHRFANFQVLRNLGVPAILLETGYLSNRDDASFLFSKKGQEAIARGIAQAVIGFLASGGAYDAPTNLALSSR